MTRRQIHITEFDKRRLEELIAVADQFGNKERNDLSALAGEVQRAKTVTSNEIPPNVVTMNSKVRLRDMDSSEELMYTLTFPIDADVSIGAISVLAPIGTALLGYAEGDVIDWPVPDGVRHIRIEEVLYQPEAAGDFHL